MVVEDKKRKKKEKKKTYCIINILIPPFNFYAE